MTTKETDSEHERRVVFVRHEAYVKPVPVLASIRRYILMKRLLANRILIRRKFVKRMGNAGLSIEDVGKGQAIEDFFLRPRTLFGWKRR